MTLKGSVFEAIEKINKPFSLRWHPGNLGRWEAILDDNGEEIRASSQSPDVVMAIVIDRYYQRSEEAER